MPKPYYPTKPKKTDAEHFAAQARSYAGNAAVGAIWASPLPPAVKPFLAHNARWALDKVLTINAKPGKKFGKPGRSYGRAPRWDNYGMSSFNHNQYNNYRMPYRRRYRRRFRRRPSRRYRRRRRYNKTRRRRYQRLNWKKGAFQGVGAQCMPTHAFCKVKRKFAGQYQFIPDTSAFLLSCNVVSHDLAKENIGIHNNASGDLFTTLGSNSVLFTTPHAITFLQDSFNQVRCSRVSVQFTFCVVPEGDVISRGHIPLTFAIMAEDVDSAATVKINVDTTNVAELMLDKHSTIKRHFPWFNNSGAATYTTGFDSPNVVRIKKTFDVPSLMEDAKRKHYWNDDDYANRITGALGSRVIATPAANGEILAQIMVGKSANIVWAAGEYVKIQVMGTITQFTTWSKPNANLRFQD